MDINIVTLIKRLWKYRRTVVLVSAAGFLLGVLFALSAKKKYDVVAKVMPETINQKSALNSLSSLGSALANLQNSTEAIYPEIYPDVVRSYPFIASLMSMEVTFLNGDDTLHTNLYDYKLNYEYKGLFRKHYDDPVPSSFDVVRLSRREDRVLRRIRRDIQATVDKKTSLLTLKVTSRSPQVAAALCGGIIDGLEKYIQDYYRGKSEDDLEYLRVMTAQARSEFYDAQARYAKAVDAGQGLSLKQSQLHQQRLKYEMNLASQLYEQISKKEQSARIKAQENRPVLAVIQPAVTPYKGHPSRVKIVFLMTFFSFVLSCVWVMFFKDELAGADTKGE